MEKKSLTNKLLNILSPIALVSAVVLVDINALDFCVTPFSYSSSSPKQIIEEYEKSSLPEKLINTGKYLAAKYNRPIFGKH